MSGKTDEKKELEHYEIVGVDVVNYPSCTCFSGFRLKDVIGSVDPFIEGNPSRESMGFDSYEDEIKWARRQIGKTLSCESLLFVAISTIGKTTFQP